MPALRPSKTSREGETAVKDLNPASILWAHQLKRENGYLLSRMTDLESTHKKYDSRIKAAEAIAKDMKAATKETKQLSARMKAIETDNEGLLEVIGKLHEEKDELMEDARVKMTDAQQSISALQTQYKSIETKLQQATVNHQSVVEKLNELEVKVRNEGNTAQKLVKKNDPGDIKVLTSRLDAIESLRKDEMRKNQLLLDKVLELEKANAELQARSLERQKEVISLSGPCTKCIPPILPPSQNTTERFESSPTPETPPPWPSGETTLNDSFESRYGSSRPGPARRREPLDESPSVNAQFRKLARKIPSPSRNNTRVVETPLPSMTYTENQATPIPNAQMNRHESTGSSKYNGANARKKRKDAPSQDPRHSPGRSKKQKTVPDENRSTGAGSARQTIQIQRRMQSTKALQHTRNLPDLRAAQEPKTPLKGKKAKRRRREIVQPVDTETFARMHASSLLRTGLPSATLAL